MSFPRHGKTEAVIASFVRRGQRSAATDAATSATHCSLAFVASHASMDVIGFADRFDQHVVVETGLSEGLEKHRFPPLDESRGVRDFRDRVAGHHDRAMPISMDEVATLDQLDGSKKLANSARF